ncbi:hypothetical protein FDC45_09700 [Clostridium botulinum]|uniref:Phage protein n=1 Tax=Clostridium botulinum TaxID=1491 RepID=A0A846J7U6_CLOBO|nr:hypothetical protein [Clostridium botulinum]ACA54583.1 phage protein [Clostridium botulinum A3 str. Loch Maree]NFH66060.1 hypothetical protein [Clostridium botulinum]NFJ09261.1 hypothetical protein [Clostridium botulinum]NFK13803.1 hypothetical protein [Clostridium botulinum]NFM95534.1 hypothetical protein [Clostridium botulinum]
MEKWGWSENEVKNFLDLLKNDNMIIKTSNKKKIIITIVNYGIYQNLKATKKSCKYTSNNDNKYINNKEEVNTIEVYQNNKYPMLGVVQI